MDGNQALRRAYRASETDGRTRFVVPKGAGFCVSLERDPRADCYWTDGINAGLWKAGEQHREAIVPLLMTARGEQ